jgi:DNA processing protein
MYFEIREKMSKTKMNQHNEQQSLFEENKNSEILPLSQDELNHYIFRTSSKPLPDLLKKQLLNGLSKEYPIIFAKGDVALLELPIVSVVGTRAPSPEGKLRAGQIAKLLVENGFVVMSGLAKGVDTIAHSTALQLSGKTIAVLGTPIHKIYPAENKSLAEDIVKEGLLLSPSLPHEEKGKFLFPRRNRLMARLSQATIIIEAGPTSGVIHQAAECLRQNRKLFLLKSVAENPSLPWVAGFLKSGAQVVENSAQLLTLLKL